MNAAPKDTKDTRAVERVIADVRARLEQCRAELDAIEQWNAAAHVNQAVIALGGQDG